MKKTLFLAFFIGFFISSAFAQDRFFHLNAKEKIDWTQTVCKGFQDCKIKNIKNYPPVKYIRLSVRGADYNEAFIIITSDNNVINIDDYAILSGIDIQKHKNYASLAKKFPNISLWPGQHDDPVATFLPGHILQLAFNYRLLNGCHACELGGIARLGFNFDAEGHLLGTVLLDLTPPPVTA